MSQPGPWKEPPPNPDLAEVFQEQLPYPAVVVKPDGPVTTQELPTRHGAAFTEHLTTTMSKVLSGPDEKRKSVQLIGDGDFLLSFTGNAGSGAVIKAGAVELLSRVLFTYNGSVWLAAVASTVDVGVIVEYWAD